MSSHRRRPQHTKGVHRTYTPAWDEDYVHPEPVRYVPEDWQEAWARTTDDVCRTVHQRWSWRLYPLDSQARDDLQDWLWVEACQFATIYQPKREPNAEEHWGSALASLLLARIRWHWAAYHGKKAIYIDEVGRKRARAVDSIDAMLERAERNQTMHATSARIANGALWASQPMGPERYVLFLELAEGPDDLSQADVTAGLCGEPACARPARTRGLCAMHYLRSLQQWGAGSDELPPTMSSQRPTTCTAEGCDEPVKMSGLCARHWLESRPLCSVEGCETHLDEKASGGMCPKHYKRLRATGTTDGPTPPTLACTVEGCDRPHLAKGMCRLHYQRARQAAS